MSREGVLYSGFGVRFMTRVGFWIRDSIYDSKGILDSGVGVRMGFLDSGSGVRFMTRKGFKIWDSGVEWGSRFWIRDSTHDSDGILDP